MKIIPFALLITAIAFVGCGKKEEPVTVVPAPAEEVPVVEEVDVPEQPESTDLSAAVTTQVEEVVETVMEAVPEMESITEAVPEISQVVDSLPEAPAVPEVEAVMPSDGSLMEGRDRNMTPPTEMEAPSVEAEATMIDDAMSAAMEVASSIDWANLSWDKVASIPYNDKEQLLAWAAPQVDSLKDTLTQAAMDKGLSGLASLGDSGWQGAIKSTVEALDGVRTSSPDTWEMATGGLVTAWNALQAEAAKYIGN